MNIKFLADFFIEDLPRGAEQNDAAVISILEQAGHTITKIKTSEFEKPNPDDHYIIGNFWDLSANAKDAFSILGNYIIYEHDYKFEETRNPARYPECIVPKDKLINEQFYLNARRIVCLTGNHKRIFYSNIPHAEITNIGSSIWSKEDFDFLRQLLPPTLEGASILDGSIWQKGNAEAIEWCTANNIPCTTINSHEDRYRFLVEFGKNKLFVFFPTVPETCSRITVEARMIGMDVVCNDLVSAKHEEWFNLAGEELIDYLESTQEQRVLQAFSLESVFDHTPILTN